MLRIPISAIQASHTLGPIAQFSKNYSKPTREETDRAYEIAFSLSPSEMTEAQLKLVRKVEAWLQREGPITLLDDDVKEPPHIVKVDQDSS